MTGLLIRRKETQAHPERRQPPEDRGRVLSDASAKHAATPRFHGHTSSSKREGNDLLYSFQGRVETSVSWLLASRIVDSKLLSF